jgi:hypothetical protein
LDVPFAAAAGAIQVELMRAKLEVQAGFLAFLGNWKSKFGQPKKFELAMNEIVERLIAEVEEFLAML